MTNCSFESFVDSFWEIDRDLGVTLIVSKSGVE